MDEYMQILCMEWHKSMYLQIMGNWINLPWRGDGNSSNGRRGTSGSHSPLIQNNKFLMILLLGICLMINGKEKQNC